MWITWHGSRYSWNRRSCWWIGETRASWYKGRIPRLRTCLSWNAARFRHNGNGVEWSREARERSGIAFLVRSARWTFADDGLFGNINYLTASVDATFLSWAFGIRSTADSLNASVLWINHKAWRAEFADGFVLFNITRSVFWTGGIFTRIAALEVDTGHSRRTAAIA